METVPLSKMKRRRKKRLARLDVTANMARESREPVDRSYTGVEETRRNRNQKHDILANMESTKPSPGRIEGAEIEAKSDSSDDDTVPGAVHVNNQGCQRQRQQVTEEVSDTMQISHGSTNHVSVDPELVVAELAPEVGDAIVVLPNEEENNQSSKRWLWMTLGCCTILILSSVVIVLVILLGRKDTAASLPTMPPSRSDSVAGNPFMTTLVPTSSSANPVMTTLEPTSSVNPAMTTVAPTSFYDVLTDLYFPTTTSTLDKVRSDAISWLVYEDDAFTQSTPPDILRERYAMAVLYFSTGGADWDWDRNTWLSGESICDWLSADGVLDNCSGESRSYLHLGTGSLLGSVPTEIGLLTQLTYLSFWQNNLESTIPSEIGSLSRLRLLSFSNNNIIGRLPSELGSLTQLTYLSVSNNKLSGSIPEELSNIRTFTYLSLYNNRFTGGLDDGMFCGIGVDQLDTYKADCGTELVCQCCTVCCNADGTCFDV